MTHVLLLIDTDDVDADVLAVHDSVIELKITAVHNEKAVRGLPLDALLVPEWHEQPLQDGVRHVWETPMGMYTISEPFIPRVV